MDFFDYAKYKTIPLDSQVISLITKIYEAKGRLALFVMSAPADLKTLAAVSKINSVKASNKLAGIVITKSRIEALLKQRSRPINLYEQEIAGYRDVLDTIEENYEYIPLSANAILQLHRNLLKYTELSSGGFKTMNNTIARYGMDGKTVKIVFEPLRPYETPAAVKAICEEYQSAIEQYALEPLMAIPIFIHDFLCVHPFNDANGRMSRLLTLLLLYQNGFTVGEYISLEKAIEMTTPDYYASLKASSESWREGTNDPLPFTKYMLRILLAAYTDFEERAILARKEKITKAEQVKRVFDTILGKITKQQLIELLPNMSEPTVKLALNRLVKDGYIQVVGKGTRSAYVKKQIL